MATQTSQPTELIVKNLQVAVEGEPILKGVDMSIRSGEIHAVMGPNGSGKSTLCYALMGHPHYEVIGGEVLLDGEDVLALAPHERAHLGMFLGFQYPREVPGVTFGNFMRHSVNAQRKATSEEGTDEAKPLGPVDFYPVMQKAVEQLAMDRKFIGRSLNEGFSGGEKKRAEIVQMAVLKPRMALLDEIDSGLDIDALKIVAEGINTVHKNVGMGILLITHYQRILNYVTPDFVHIMSAGKIIQSGGSELAHELEAKGYEPFVTA